MSNPEVGSPTRHKKPALTAVAAVLVALACACLTLPASLLATNRAVVVGFGAFDVGLGSTTAAKTIYLGMPPVTQSSTAALGTSHCASSDPHYVTLGAIGLGIVGCNRWEPVVQLVPGPGATPPAGRPTP